MPSPTHRRWFQFGSLSLLVLMTLIAVVCALFVVPGWRQQQAVAQILDLGGYVVYEFEESNAGPVRVPNRLRKLIGDDYFYRVTFVGLIGKGKNWGNEFDDPDKLSAAIAEIGKLRGVVGLTMNTAGLTPDHVRQIAKLSQIDSLSISASMTDSCLTEIAPLTQLRRLQAWGTFTDASLSSVAQLTQLRILGLDGAVTDAGMPQLVALANLETLQCQVWSSTISQKIRALDEKTDLEFEDVGVVDVIDFLRQKHEINILFDEQAIADAGIDLDRTTVPFIVSGITLREALARTLDPLGLGFNINPGHLIVTTRAEVERAHAGINQLRRELPNLRSVEVGW